ncbi:MAG: patatin-like phospholipase family protein [Myxococcota bacterium]|nr:patatin-like phospholipase family protein [Myxococcota bacterium]
MGLTLIRNSKGRPPKRNPRLALVLAGGAVSGGAFKVGGLKALNDFFVGRGVGDFDMYVGLSAGAVLAVPLAAGIEPDEMVRVLEGSSERFDQLRPIDFYSPNVDEFIARPAKFAYDLASYLPGVTYDFLRGLPTLPESLGGEARRFAKQPTYKNFETFVMRLIDHTAPKRRLPALTNHVPSGVFDNKPLERWLRRGLEKLDMPNDFRAFNRRRNRQLFLSACNLDTAERVIFGADENADVTISEAMQASTALPGFFRPARINGVDYVDGGIRNTANIDVAIEKGADLIVCYNPFRPFFNDTDAQAENGSPYFADGRYLSDRGLKVVLNQVMRTLLHSRLKLAMQRYLADDRFDGDIVLLEPQEREAEFFALNPLAFWKRAEAVEHGFTSVRQTIEQNFVELREVFASYGLEMSRQAAQEKADQAHEERGWTGRDEPAEGPPLRVVEN